MLSGKTTSIKRVIENVYRDYGFTNELNPQDAIEWAADAFDKIGVPVMYKDKIECVTITNHRGMLPCDIHTLIAVREDDSKLPLIYSSDVFLMGDVCADESEELSCTTGNCRPIVVDSSGSVDPDDNTFCNPFFNFNPNPDTTQLATQDLTSEMLTYMVNNDYIFTGFQNGCVQMAYKAFPVDANNLPLIPDDTRIIDAIVKYIAYKVILKRSIREDMTPSLSAKLAKTEQDWLFAVGNAKCNTLMPSLDQAAALKAGWVRLVPRTNVELWGYKYMGQSEQRFVNSK